MKWKKQKNSFCLIAGLGLLANLAWAQKNYTDYKPQYREWRMNYIVDKIQYTENEIIFFFRYYSISNGTQVDFWFNEPKQYCLENVDNPVETFYTTDIRNIRVGGALKCLSMAELKLTNFTTRIPANVTITCEVHFPRIPNHISKVHFLEGKEFRKYDNHFHAFSVQMKQWNDKNLGTAEERLERIARFENTNYNPVQPTSVRKIWYKPDLNKNIQYNNEAKVRI